MTLSDVWEALAGEKSGPGEVRRRIRPDSKADLWLVIYRPSGVRALRVSVTSDLEGLDDLPSGQGIDLSVTSGGDGSAVLEISLANLSFADLFNAFVADITETAAAASAASDVPQLVTDRVRRWQSFLKENVEGLSSERQRGLYGELNVLHRVGASIGWDFAVGGWVGPAGAPQDFALRGVAIEVKTSAGKNPQRLRISSERQLDDSVVDRLFLWHLSVDERVGGGESLPSLVNRLRSELSGSSVQSRFEETLLAAGYHDVHASRYSTGYSLRASGIFEVSGEFPRIVEADCPAGLGDVHYSLELGGLQDFLTERDRLMTLLAEVSVDD